ncbi:thioester domain-containing protein [Streptomyces sp. NPDC097619]|uniref:thioester domain-containing protein n=1 Tax=Streptomyces sp. NPDC097619 TaxID=3157228 RepID=UPI00331A583A
MAAGALLAAALAGGACGSAAAVVGAPDRQAGAGAVLDGPVTTGQALLRAPEGVRRIPAGLYEMRVDGGGTLQTYGLDVAGMAPRETRYAETPWAESPLAGNREAGRVRWIVQHSYPQVNDLAGLARAAGAKALTAESAAAGTQVAIWRVTGATAVEAADPAAEKLADHLQKEARRMAEPAASLGLGPGSVAGRAGRLLGPLTVSTGAQSVAVVLDEAAAARGIRVVGKDGAAITEAVNGTRLWFTVPEDSPGGTASVTVQGTTRVPVGRVLTGGLPDQAQVVAGSSEAVTAATASAVWTASGSVGTLAAPVTALPAPGASASDGTESHGDRLAASGSSAATPVIAALAVGLVVLGAGVVLALRKRPSDH